MTADVSRHPYVRGTRVLRYGSVLRAAEARVAVLLLCLVLAGGTARGASDTPAQPVALPGALALELPGTRFDENAVLKANFRGDWHPAENLLRILYIDGLGRVISHVEIDTATKKAPSEPITFEFPLRGGFGIEHRLVLVTAPRSKKNDPAWRIAAEAKFTVVPQRKPWDGFAVLLPRSQRFESDEARAQIARLPVNGRIDDFLDPTAPAVNDAADAWTHRLHTALGEQGHPLHALDDGRWNTIHEQFTARGIAGLTRVPPLFEQAALDRALKLLNDRTWSLAADRPLGYSLGHELSLTRTTRALDLLPSAETLELFQAWLKRRYMDLQELNAVWHTGFKEWREVRPPSTDEMLGALQPRFAERMKILRGGNADEELPEVDGHALFTLKPSELAPPGRENCAAWLEWHAFLDFAFARLLNEFTHTVRAADPGALCGLTGACEPSPWGGWDAARVAPQLDWYLPSDHGPTRELFGSFRPGIRSVNLTNVSGGQARRQLWDGWMRGDAGTVLVNAEGLFTDADGVRPNHAAPLIEDLDALANGLTLLRNGASAAKPHIGIYYSPRSLALHWLSDAAPRGSAWADKNSAADGTGLRAIEAWRVLLSDLGFEARFVGEQELLAKGAGLDVKVLILPKVLSLGANEAKALQDFARLSGIVLADSQCGTYDEYGRRYRGMATDPHTGILDRDFGVRREHLWAHELAGAWMGEAAAARVRLFDPARPVDLGPDSDELRVNEPGLRATGAWSHARTDGGAAALAVHSAGVGRFVYLNLALQDYPELRAKDETDFRMASIDRRMYLAKYGNPTGGEALRILVGNLLEEAVREPNLSVRDATGRALRGAARKLWRDGPVALAAVLAPAHATEPTAVRVVYDHACHWYDLRTGTYLGLGTECSARLAPGAAAVLAALDYRVRALEAKIRRLDPLGAFHLAFEIDADQDGADTAGDDEELGRHVLRLEFFDPQGRHLPHYSRAVPALAGKWEGSFNLGLNEPAGLYRCVATDLLSGLRREFQLLKDGAPYAGLLPMAGVTQQWRPEPRGESLHVEVDERGELNVEWPMRLRPAGEGLQAPPALVAKCSKGWHAEIAEMALPDRRAHPNPRPQPLPFVVKLQARAAELPAAAGVLQLALGETAGDEQAFRFVLPVAAVPPAPGAVTVDGRTDDPGWKNQQVSAYLSANDGTDPSAETQTAVAVRRDGENLLLAAYLGDPEFEALRAHKQLAKKRDEAKIDEGDWFEVTLYSAEQPSATLRLRFDCLGTLRDSRNGDVSWNGHAQARTARTETGWVLELAVPWRDLGLKGPPAAGRVLRAAFARQRHTAKGLLERTAWHGGPPQSDPSPAALGVLLSTEK